METVAFGCLKMSETEVSETERGEREKERGGGGEQNLGVTDIN